MSYSLRKHLQKLAQSEKDKNVLEIISSMPTEREKAKGKEPEPIVTTKIDNLSATASRRYILSNKDSNINKYVYSKMPKDLHKLLSPRGHISYTRPESLLGQKPEDHATTAVIDTTEETERRSSTNARKEW